MFARIWLHEYTTFDVRAYLRYSSGSCSESPGQSIIPMPRMAEGAGEYDRR